VRLKQRLNTFTSNIFYYNYRNNTTEAGLPFSPEGAILVRPVYVIHNKNIKKRFGFYQKVLNHN